MTVNEIYNQLAQIIIDSVIEDWQVANLYVERLEKYTGAFGRYLNKEGIECRMNDAKFGYSFSLLIHELHSITTEGGHNRWNKLKFTLYPTGKFEMDFIWDQEYQDKVDNVK